jgi:hypothetical protein
MKNGHEIKTVIGTQRKIRTVIAALVAAKKPVFDVQVKRSGLLHIATIKTYKPITARHV